jgi:hypothetical protein
MYALGAEGESLNAFGGYRGMEDEVEGPTPTWRTSTSR